MAHHHGLPARELTPRGDRRRLTAARRRRPRRRRALRGRRDRQPGLGRLRDRQGRPRPRRALRRGRRASPASAWTRGARHRRRDRPRRRSSARSPCIAAGLWSRDLGLLAGARLPLHPAEHYWAQTEPVEGATRDLPIVRDLDGSDLRAPLPRRPARRRVRARRQAAHRPRRSRRTSRSASSSPTWSTSSARSRSARERVPALAEARFAHYLCAPESFTPDGNFLLGETGRGGRPLRRRRHELAGHHPRSRRRPGAGGVDRRRARRRWTRPTLDVRRFSPAQAGAGYLFERTRESLGRLYAMHWPFLQPGTARGLRRVPLYDRLAAAGACFGEAAGWERADWYAPPGERPEYEYSFGRQNWFGAVADEHRAAREGVALFDLSSFAKLRVEGPGALATVQRVFTADLDRPPGSRRVHVHAQRPRRRRARRDGDAARRATPSWSSPRRRRRPGRSTGCAATRTRAPWSPTSPPASACSR